MLPLVSICIASHNMAHLLNELLESCVHQDYENIEIILLNDASTDDTEKDFGTIVQIGNMSLKYFRSEEPSGTGGAFNKAISHATGDIIVLMCADDLFTNTKVISDIVKIFEHQKDVIHVTRYYHQFIDGDPRPVRAWRTNHVLELANNPSGLAFRKSAIGDCKLSNKMFVEASSFVWDILQSNRYYRRSQISCMIIDWDTVAVRIHSSISQNKNYYLKMWKSSPIEEWSKVGGAPLLKDYTSLIQIKNNFKTSAVAKEVWNFARLRPVNLLHPAFYFFAMVALFTPRAILRRVPDFYRRTFGRWTTREIKRP